MTQEQRKNLINKIIKKYGVNDEYKYALFSDDKELILLCKIIGIK